MATLKKAKSPKDASKLSQIPNIGPAMVEDFKVLGIREPIQLKGLDAYDLYVKLCDKTKTYHDPCVLDTFISAVSFMDGKGAKPWWEFTEGRKQNFKRVESKVKKWQAVK